MSDQIPSVIDGEFLDALETLDFYIRKTMSGYFGGNRRTRAYGNSMDFADYREYTLVDDLRRIDWNLVARFEKYYVKQFTDERQLQNIVYLDTSASMGCDSSGTKWKAVLQMAAAIGYLSIQNSDRVSYRLLSGYSCSDLCYSVMGKDAFYNSVNKLCGIHYCGSVDLNAAVRADPNPGYDNGLSFIISDFLTNDDWHSAVDYILSCHREVVLVQILSPEEIDPVLHGKTSFRDAETIGGSPEDDYRLEINRGAILAYRDAVAYFKNEMKVFCASRGVVLLSLQSDKSVIKAILEQGYETGLIK